MVCTVRQILPAVGQYRPYLLSDTATIYTIINDTRRWHSVGIYLQSTIIYTKSFCMKSRFFIVAATILATAACKTPYRATERTTPATDSTVSPTDTTAMNQMPVSPDSAMMQRDTSRAIIDSTNQSLPDSAKILSVTDSARMKNAIDSARTQPTSDSTQMQPGIDTSAATVQPPAILETAFNKQYPGATNVVWSNYDSLAAIPIDMRLTGWKKMDAEDYMVTFNYKDQNYYAWYDNSGKWVGSAYTMEDFTKMPAAVHTAVKNAIKKRYNDYNISQVNREFRAGNKSAYEVELTRDDDKVKMLVNADGKIGKIFKYSSDK